MGSAKQTLHEKPNIKGDRVNIMLLVLMYTLQNLIPGFFQAFPIIFQKRGVPYADQAEFSFAGYPSCLKLLWAPIIDCMFSRRIGRRKTWIMPMQYLIGLLLMYLSIHLDDWLGTEDGKTQPRIRLLGVIFFCCQLFSAVQDVALDGWALTIVQRRNIGYAGFSQSAGSVIGTFLGYVGFLMLDSKDFANRFRTVPQDRGFVTMSEYMFLWSMVFIIATTLIFILKKDDSLEVIEDGGGEFRLSLADSYKHLWNVAKRPPIIALCFIGLTMQMGFGPVLAVSPLKIIDAGIPRDTFVLLTIPALPFQLFLPIIMRKYATGPRPMHSVVTNNILLLATSVLVALVLFFAPLARGQSESLPVWYHCVLFTLYNGRTIFRHFELLSMCTFYCRISDPRYGGIYLTLLYTIMNIGIHWPQTLSLWVVDPLTIQNCSEEGIPGASSCTTKVDGYYTETVIFAGLGLLWLMWAIREMYRLQRLEATAWIVEGEDKKCFESEKKDGVYAHDAL